MVEGRLVKNPLETDCAVAVLKWVFVAIYLHNLFTGLTSFVVRLLPRTHSQPEVIRGHASAWVRLGIQSPEYVAKLPTAHKKGSNWF